MPTLMDIAKIAKVSKSTVSKALSDSSEISRETKDKIFEIADSIGYTPNETAQILAGKKSYTIGLVVSEIDSNYYNDVVGVIERELKKKNYSLLIALTGFNIDNQIHYIKLFLQKRVDGMIIKPISSKAYTDKMQQISKFLNTPVVLLGKALPGVDINTIEDNNIQAMKLAVEHLIGLGHKNIYFIGDKISEARKLLFMDALKRKGLECGIGHIKEGVERFQLGGYLRMNELLVEHRRDFAVIAHYDSMANGAMKAILEKKLRIPDDISILGFDNIQESEFYQIPLTTVGFPKDEIGRQTVNMLFEEITHGSDIQKKNITLEPELIIRDSTGKAR